MRNYLWHSPVQEVHPLVVFLYRAHGFVGMDQQMSHLRVGLSTAQISTSSAFSHEKFFIVNYQFTF